MFCSIFLFLIMNVSAATDTNIVDDTFKVDKTVEYSKPCFDNGTYCSASAVCNFTVFNPENTIVINNQQAVNNLAYHSLNISFDEIGLWKIDIVCVDGGRKGADTFYAQVSGDGFNDSLGFYIIIVCLSLGVIILGMWMEDPIIIIFGSFGLYFLSLYILFNGITGIKDSVTTWAIGLIVLGIAMYVSIRSTHELITNGG